MVEMKLVAFCVAICLILSAIQTAEGKDSDTPLAGQPYHTELWGMDIHIPPRDRRHVTAINAGGQWIPDGPSQLELVPFGALFMWRNWENDNQRFRGTFSGVVNNLYYQRGLTSMSPWFAVLTFENVILPFGRAEYVEGQRIRDVELEWNYVFGGIGFGYRSSLFPWNQDNAFELALTYEPGFRWFDRTSKTAGNFIVPQDTYEGRTHLRVRVDMLERNLIELLHQGVAFGGDVFYGHRAQWRRWGGTEFDIPDPDKERTYVSASIYAAMADRLPLLNNERHRLIATIYGGIGKNLDRFSTFRLPGRPTGSEWEAISLPLIPGVAFNELFPRKYAIANLTYRYEALFFLYPYIRGTWAAVERPRFRQDGSINIQVDMLPALGTGVVSGAPWQSQIEVNYSYNFGMFRDRQGPEKGGHSLMVFWSKLL
jgi:hypothetical protein